MSVTEIANLAPRERCRGCGQRFGGNDRSDELPRPWVSFGIDTDPEIEDTDGKLWRHSRVLVCGGCLRKASKSIPDADNRVDELETALSHAENARADAIATARGLAEIVNARLASVAPETLPNFDEMDAPELREWAKENEVKIGPGNHGADKLRELIREQIGTSE